MTELIEFGGPPGSGSYVSLAGGSSVQDTVAAAVPTVQIEHYGAGAAQAYGLDIHNYNSAKAAIVVHEYSDADSAVQIDNTRSQPALTIRNTQNQVLANGFQGTGDYFYFQGDLGTPGTPNVQTFLRLDKDLIFRAAQSTKPLTFQPDAGIGVKIVQANATWAQFISHSGAAIGWEMDVAAGAAGFYPMFLNGYNYGPKFLTTQDSGDNLTVQKDSTGAGVLIKVVNKGTGDSLQLRDGTNQKFTVAAGGFISVIQGISVNVLAGTGSPEGVKTAPIGSVFHRSDGGAGTCLYVKESGAGNTGWVAK